MSESLPNALLQYVEHGREERTLEYKEMLDWSSPKHQAKVVKAVLGMSNVRYGGVLVVGVKKDGAPVGVNKQHAQAFTQDGVASVVAEYAAPFAEATVTTGHHPDDQSRWFVVIEVNEFSEVPVLCRKDGHDLRQGAIYTRGRRIHETSEVRSESEMREILDMAVEKAIRAFHGRVRAAGLTLAPSASHEQLFDDQLEGL